jgi:NADH-quinone oxidoreductase subunit N
MYLSDPAEDGPTVSVPGGFTAAALTIGVLATLALGVVPTQLLDLAGQAAQFVR